MRACAILRRRRELSDERGFTLVEMLITVWIMGAVVVTFVGALFASVHASDLQSRTTIGESELRHYAEIMRGLPYVPCAAPSDYQTQADAIYAAPPGVTVVNKGIFGLSYWNKAADGTSLPTTFVPANQHPGCTSSDPTDDGVQKVLVYITIGSSPNVFTYTVILKRNNGVL